MTALDSTTERSIMEEPDFLQIKSVDHIRFWVGNAKQAMYYWWKGFGFRPVAYSGLENGNRRSASYVLESGNIRIIVTAAYSPTDEIAAHHLLRGDSVVHIALGVDDVEQAYRTTTRRGAVGVWGPRERRDENGILRTSAIRTYGEVIHVFLDRSDYRGAFAPGYERLDLTTDGAGLLSVDHAVGNVQLGKLNQWMDFYERLMGFRRLNHLDSQDIGGKHSMLMSKEVRDGTRSIDFAIYEAAEGKGESQVEEHAVFNIGPGVQHIALTTSEILATVESLRQRGIEFLGVPEGYHDTLADRVGEIDEPWAEIAAQGVLVDRDDEGYLLQIFSRPIQDRPTAFIEVIERHGSRGFGRGNFRALFYEALELGQE